MTSFKISMGAAASPNRASLVAACAAFFASFSAQAMENGVSSFPIGAFDFGSGFLPPPGDSFVLRYNNYRATKLKDNNGNQVTGFAVAPGVVLPADVDVTVDSGAVTYLHVTNYKIGDANYAFGGTIPVTFKSSVKTIAGMSPDSASGVAGDVVLDPFILTWHRPNYHFALGTHIVVPVASYDPNKQAQITRNAYSLQFDLPVTYISNTGFEVSLKPNLSLNGKNSKTGYKSGHEFMLEYAVGQHFGPHWTAGLAGYWQKQLTDDTTSGAINYGRSQVFGIGPSLLYFNKGVAIALKYVVESHAKNRSEGKSLWVRAVIPF